MRSALCDSCFRLKAGGRSSNLEVHRTAPQAVAVAVRLDPLRLAGVLGDAMRYAPCLPAEALAQAGPYLSSVAEMTA